MCLLKKAIYGLKQASREWNATLDAFVRRSLGFSRLVSDSCVDTKRSAAAVDNIPSAIAEEDAEEWANIKLQFEQRFKIKFLGGADWVLSMRIRRDKQGRRLYVDQQAYVDTLLEEMHMDESHAVPTPGAQQPLSKQQCPQNEDERASMSVVPYRRTVGALMYLANTSRPDIGHAVHSVAQFAQDPGQVHWQAVKRILRYLCGTAEYGLVFDGSIPLQLQVFADANWAGCIDSRRSTSGWLIMLGGSVIDWSCKRQDTVALSSCESEYMAISSAVQGVLWTVSLLGELGIAQQSAPIMVRNDNKSAIAITQNDVMHGRSKHIDIRHHFVRDEVLRRTVHMQWISTEEQVADIFTKAFGPMLFRKFRDRIVISCKETAEEAAPQQRE